MGLFIYNVVLWSATPAALLYLAWHVFVTGKFRTSWRERLTMGIPEAPSAPVIHLHAASLGEAISLGPFVAELRRRLPDHALVVTSLSETGHRAVVERLKPDVATCLPLDYGPLVSRFFDRYHPRLLVLVETELWPNLMATAAHRRVPIMVANGRISPGTIRRYHWFSLLYEPLVERIAEFAAQSADDAERARSIGVPADRIHVVGDVKFDQIAANPSSPRLTQIRQSLTAPGPRVLAAGSTHPGEHEAIVADFATLVAEQPDTFMILAPRHPEALPAVRRVLDAAGLPYLNRSRQRDEALPWTAEHKVLLVDTIGELAFLYDLCRVAFVGGSLAPVGGHSPLEPAVMGRPVLFGPQAFNFRDTNDLLLTAGGARLVADHASLAAAVRELLDDGDLATAMGDRARQAVLSRSGASAATAALAAGLLERWNS